MPYVCLRFIVKGHPLQQTAADTEALTSASYGDRDNRTETESDRDRERETVTDGDRWKQGKRRAPQRGAFFRVLLL